MNIQSTQFQRPSVTARPQQSPENDPSTFFMDFDPLGGIKDAAEDVVDLGFRFGMGALPGFGAQTHAEIAILGGFSGRGQSDTTLAVAGGVSNVVGTGSLLVAGGQMLFGADPSLALGIGAAGLAGSGIASSILLR